MILLLDNYDSFTYNLVQRIGELDPSIDVRVVRNDKITVAEAEAAAPTHLLLSPGPCTPRETGVYGPRDMFLAMTCDPDDFVDRLRDRIKREYRRLPYPITSALFVVTRDGVAGTQAA